MCRPNCSGTRASASGWKASTLSSPAVICRKNISNTSQTSPPSPSCTSTATTTAVTRSQNRVAASVWTMRSMSGRGCASWVWAGAIGTTGTIPSSTPKLKCGGASGSSGSRPGGRADGTDKAHKGFQVFNDLMDLYQPKWFIHGHMHLNYGANLPRVCTRGGTTVINATERYEFEIPDPVQVPKRKLFGLR